MTSVERAPRQVPVNALYTNIKAVQSTVYDVTGLAVAPWVVNYGGLSTVGAVLLRDMGKTVYVPDPTVPTSVGSQSTILRKVQLVAGYYGTGGNPSGTGGATASTEYLTGYIKLGAQTYGGGGDPLAGNAAAPGFVRAN
jgi:hypothetical protein